MIFTYMYIAGIIRMWWTKQSRRHERDRIYQRKLILSAYLQYSNTIKDKFCGDINSPIPNH